MTLLLFAAAVLAGAVNSVAGGGILFTFPALLAVGISPIVANATSTVALVPGALSSLWGYRHEVKIGWRTLIAFGIPSLLGGALGAWVVQRAGDALFRKLVPWLILGAVALFLFEGPIRRALQWRIDSEAAPAGDRAFRIGPTVLLYQFLVATYGGFFGPGMGIMMLAAFGLMGMTNIHQMNGLKNYSAACINGMATVTFAAMGKVQWLLALLMAAGTLLGGFGGAGIARRLGQTTVRRLVSLIGLGIGLYMLAARAQDRFEIQVYDSETAPAWTVGLETHLNFTARGTQEGTPEGELPTQHLARFTLEPHLGLNDFIEMGAYFQTVLRPDGGFDYAGLKLRLKMKLREKAFGWLGLALNGELSSVPRAYEANRFGSELRPIADVHWRRLYASINPIISVDLAGSEAGRLQLQPAAKLGVDLFAFLQAGAEYYAGLGPITGIFPASKQTHLLFAVVDFTSAYFDLNVGAGYGFSGDNRWVIKTILGFHPKAGSVR